MFKNLVIINIVVFFIFSYFSENERKISLFPLFIRANGDSEKIEEKENPKAEKIMKSIFFRLFYF